MGPWSLFPLSYCLPKGWQPQAHHGLQNSERFPCLLQIQKDFALQYLTTPHGRDMDSHNRTTGCFLHPKHPVITQSVSAICGRKPVPIQGFSIWDLDCTMSIYKNYGSGCSLPPPIRPGCLPIS